MFQSHTKIRSSMALSTEYYGQMNGQIYGQKYDDKIEKIQVCVKMH